VALLIRAARAFRGGGSPRSSPLPLPQAQPQATGGPGWSLSPTAAAIVSETPSVVSFGSSCVSRVPSLDTVGTGMMMMMTTPDGGGAAAVAVSPVSAASGARGEGGHGEGEGEGEGQGPLKRRKVA
jgi:hypothetical protein